MDVVADVAWRLHARGFSGEPRLHQVRREARLLVGAERVRDHELLEGETLAIGIRLGGRGGQALGEPVGVKGTQRLRTGPSFASKTLPVKTRRPHPRSFSALNTSGRR